MKHYLFGIAGNKIDEYHGEVSGTGPDYHLYEKSFGVEEIYYKTENGKVTDVICEAFSQKSAEKAINEFLSTLQ